MTPHLLTCHPRPPTISPMTLVIGVDEAGYGPNLGPLVIGLSAWRVAEGEKGVRNRFQVCSSDTRASGKTVPDTFFSFNLYRLLRRYVTPTPDGVRVAIADSKVLYKPGGGLDLLAQGVHAVDPDARRHFEEQRAGQVDLDCEAMAPSTTPRCRLGERARPLPLAARMIFPAEFNRLVDQHGTKGTLLSHATLGLVRDAIGKQEACRVRVTCDKHGGRNRYGELLATFFPAATIEPLVESREVSRYRLLDDARTIEFVFRAKGEALLETALASMTAKYLRELAMQAFNRFWQRHIPDLKPTAGYPNDARRFYEAIEPVCRKLGLAEEQVWRGR